MSNTFSPEYIQLRQQGAFAGRIDPFAEDTRYFHQFHNIMMNEILLAIQDTLQAKGYTANLVPSIQINPKFPPNISIKQQGSGFQGDYATLARKIGVHPGTQAKEEDPELSAIHITAPNTDDLVTVIELISPVAKYDAYNAVMYPRQRHSLRQKAVHIVEIDCTRSYWRTSPNKLTVESPYHIAIHLAFDSIRVIAIDFLEPMPAFALPLAGEAIRVEPQQAYDRAYQRGAIAGLILQEEQYTRDVLPFPSTLTEAQIEQALQAVKAWQAELKRLAQQS